jgi:hypothetical protein
MIDVPIVPSSGNASPTSPSLKALLTASTI